jgi:hypothetical protein
MQAEVSIRLGGSRPFEVLHAGRPNHAIAFMNCGYAFPNEIGLSSRTARTTWC